MEDIIYDLAIKEQIEEFQTRKWSDDFDTETVEHKNIDKEARDAMLEFF